ncbi:MAG: hypothetical protein R3F59_38270 [Myxococcota bacterium]
MPAQVRVAVLDSCASGAMIAAKGGRAVAPFLTDLGADHEGFAYLTSSAADEVAQEAERIGGSYFTHFLASGLRGAADASGDGRVTLSEAYSYANAETLARTERTQHGPQHPRYETQLTGTGDFVLTDLARTHAMLVVGEGIAGTVSVRSDTGALVAEVDKPLRRPVVLGLTPGRYALTVVRGDGRYGEAMVQVGPSPARVAPGDLEWHLGDPTATRGRLVRVAATPEPPDRSADRLLLGVLAAGTADLRGFGVAPAYVGADRLHGLAVALGANVAGGGRGVQLAAVNVTGRRSRGGQVGLVNAARGLGGLQLGLVNAGGDVRGLQLGLVNVARGSSGVQLGLVNLSRDGRHDLLLLGGSAEPVQLELRTGGRVLYTVLGGGAGLGEERLHGFLAAGGGVHAAFGPRWWLDADAAYHLYPGDVPSAVVGRVTAGVQLRPELAPVVGAGLGVERPGGAWGAWPFVTVGLQR